MYKKLIRYQPNGSDSSEDKRDYDEAVLKELELKVEILGYNRVKKLKDENHLSVC